MFDKVDLPAYGDHFREHILVSDCTTYTDVPSILAPGKVQHVSAFNCPRCQREFREEPEHSKVVKCKCGLYMQAYGNGLTIWEQ